MFKSLSTFTHRVSGQRCHFLSAAALPLLPPVFLSSPPIVHHTKMDIGVLCPNNTNKIFWPKENGTEFLVMRQKNPKIYERAFAEKPLIVQRKCVELYARKPEANPLTLSHQRIWGSVWHPSTEVFFNPLNMNVLFSNFSLGGKKNIIISYK